MKRNRKVIFLINEEEYSTLNRNCGMMGLDMSSYLRFLIKFSARVNEMIEESLKGGKQNENTKNP